MLKLDYMSTLFNCMKKAILPLFATSALRVAPWRLLALSEGCSLGQQTAVACLASSLVPFSWPLWPLC